MSGKGIAMPLIILLVVLSVLRFFEIWRFAQLSWGWIIALAVLAFIWFEFIEKMLGLDKKKAHRTDEARKKERVKEAFYKKK
jgi:small Trp-rich protein